MSSKRRWQIAIILLVEMLVSSCGHKLPPETQQPSLLPAIPFHT